MTYEREKRFFFALQLFAILTVVFRHSFFQREYLLPVQWVVTFHMPLFMFVSGALLELSCQRAGVTIADKMNWKFMLGKVRRLLLPYLVVSTVAFFPKTLLSSFAGRTVECSLDSYWQMLVLPSRNVIGFFWFLPTLFFIFAIVFLAVSLAKRCGIRLPAIVILLVLLVVHVLVPSRDDQILNLTNACNYLVYFVAGIYFRRHLFDWAVCYKVGVFCVTFAISVACLFVTRLEEMDALWAFNGILMSVSLALCYESSKWHFADRFFGASYMVYLLSWFFQVGSQQVFLKLTGAPWYVGSMLAFVTGFLVPFLILKLLTRFNKKTVARFALFVLGH